MSDARHEARLVTVVFLRCGDHVLLLRHANTSDRFPGRWNGIGGHVNAGEDIRAAAKRELREEAGLDVSGLRLCAVIHETGLLGRAHVLFVFAGETESRTAPRPPAGVEVSWHRLTDVDALPLVNDVPELLRRIWSAPETIFATQHFDGGDRPIDFRFDDDNRAGGRPGV